MKWSDLLRVKAEFPINLWPNAAQAYHRWIRTSIRDNKPYDQFVREMLTSSGSNFRVPQVNFYRAVQSREPQALAQAVALTFMGMRAEKWPKERLAGMAAFFSQVAYKSTAEWKEEIVFFDPAKAAARGRGRSSPTGRRRTWPPTKDPREVFADWLIDAEEPLVHAGHRQPRLVLAAGPRHHPRARRHPARQSARATPSCWRTWRGTGRLALRPEAPLSADPELADLPAFVVAGSPRSPRRRPTSRTIRSAGWRPRC